MEGFNDLGSIQENRSGHWEVFLGKYLLLNFKNWKGDTWNSGKNTYERVTFYSEAAGLQPANLLNLNVPSRVFLENIAINLG